LISRRPLPSGPAALPLLGSPRAARKPSTVLWMEAAVLSPPAEKTMNPPWQTPPKAVTSKRAEARAIDRISRSILVLPFSGTPGGAGYRRRGEGVLQRRQEEVALHDADGRGFPVPDAG